MSKPATVRDEQGQPFSKWKPADKYNYVLSRDQFAIWSNCKMEHSFDETKRAFDFAWPNQSVAVEIDGFGHGHQAVHRLSQNHEKQNDAVMRGWKVLRYTSRQLGSMAGVERAVEETARLICGVKQ